MAHFGKLFQDPDEVISQPFAYINQNGPEKRNMMSKLWSSFNFWFECPRDKKQRMTEILDDSLSIIYLLDDMADNSVRRRGLPTAHLIFGTPLTIYSAIFVTFSTWDKVISFEEHKEVLAKYFEDMHRLITYSQMLRDHFAQMGICPTYQEYEQLMCSNEWIPFAFKLMQVHSKNKLPDATNTVKEKLGSFVQIYNDYIGLQSPKYCQMKTFCEDLSEGRFNFPTIHAIQSQKDDRVLEIVKEKPTDLEKKKRFVSILEELGSFEFTRKTLKTLKSQILEELEYLYGAKNPYMRKAFDDILTNLESDDELFFDIPMFA